MNKFLRILVFNFKVETKFTVDYVIKLVIFMFHIIVFKQMWDYLLKDKAVLGYTKENMIWYIIIGEALLYTMSKNYIKISNMVKSGDIANILIRPINVLEYIFLMEITTIINLFLNFIIAAIYGIMLTGFPSISTTNLILFFISVILSYIILLETQLLIGILAFFFEENEVFYFIISKACLITTMTPLNFFSGFSYSFMSCLPTTYIAYAPGRIFLNCNIDLALHLILCQILSFLVCTFLLIILTKKGVKKINVNGG